MLTLGLNAFHGDASACIFKNGRLIAAAEEERFSRIKHAAGFPAAAVSYCLQAAGAEVRDLDLVAVNSDASARLGRKLTYALRHPPTPAYLMERIRHRRARSDIGRCFERSLGALEPATRIVPVEHHRCHLASSYYFSPFSRASVLSIDGFGDFCSAAWGIGEETSLSIDGEVLFPHSLGIFYQAMTQYLGFPHYGDEYKVMGLAPYGEPLFMSEMEQLAKPLENGAFALELKYFGHHRETMSFRWPGGAPKFGPLFSCDLEALLGPARRPGSDLSKRHKNIARSVQTHFEALLANLLVRLRGQHGLDDLCLAGGCAMNSVAVGRVQQQGIFKRIFVQPAAGDAGGALGAALCAELASNRRLERRPMQITGWGPEYDDDDIGRLLQSRNTELTTADVRISHFETVEALCERLATALANGEVVGWFQGRMEWGPRALGHRSILADPRVADMKSILNRKIKRRESFRPFAPSILRETVPEWFDVDDDVPFMTKVFPVKPERRALIPAVTHVDGSARLQTVTREQNPEFYELIRQFGALTGVPILLNTSFNENEPIVCSPQEAIECFLRTEMDWLVLHRHALHRHRGRT